MTKPRTIMNNLVKLGKALNLDAWANTLTGLGTSRDKQRGLSIWAGARLTDPELEILYEEDDIAAKIVDAPISDGLRQGIEITISADEGEGVEENKDMEAAVKGAIDDLNLVENIAEAATWGRLFGGGVIYPILDDSGLPEQPLNLDTVRSVRSMIVLDKRDIQVEKWDSDPRSKNFGKPELYRVVQAKPDGAIAAVAIIHASRLVVFDGVRTTFRRIQANNGWKNSVLQRVHNTILQFHQSNMSTAHLMTDSAQGVYKLKGLIAMIASGNKTILEDRVQVIEMGKSVVKGIMLDAESEEYERKQTTLTGYSDVLRHFALLVAAAADMPLTVLMGQSPAGLNATGESDRGLWDEKVQAYQRFRLKPQIEQLMTIIMSAKDGPTKGVVPENWSVVFPPLRQMTQTETTALRKSVAETDAIYIDRNVLDPASVALSRFGRGGYSIETQIDHDAIEAIAEADRERIMNGEPDPKDPDAVAAAIAAQAAAGGELPPGTASNPDDQSTAVLTPSAQAAVMTVNEARRQIRLPEIPGGDVPISVYQAKQEAEIENDKPAPSDPDPADEE